MIPFDINTATQNQRSFYDELVRWLAGDKHDCTATEMLAHASFVLGDSYQDAVKQAGLDALEYKTRQHNGEEGAAIVESNNDRDRHH